MAPAFGFHGSPTEELLDSSTPAITNRFVESIYSKLSPVYDALFGAVLQPGRIAAVTQMGDAAGTRVLEVGIGTGIGARLYPRSFEVTGIDLCSRMLENARKRIAREGLQHITLKRMDAARLEIDANSFDVVYAPYTISAVPDPVQVALEMRRVCRPGGRIVILNHFRSSSPIAALLERLIAPVTIHLGFRSDLDLSTLLARAQLKRLSIEKVNVPPIWSLVTCMKS
jgi:phosphatidylethanolamine/phosphatidyl-N-methylethanolamine N-methyltransferase